MILGINYTLKELDVKSFCSISNRGSDSFNIKAIGIKKCNHFTNLFKMGKILEKETKRNAGLIKQHLEISGECSILDLKSRLKMNDKEFFAALNWLIKFKRIKLFPKERV